MHIRECTISNITSYRNSTTLKFSPKLNIFIGPNGGGKTNAIQALWLPLQRFLFSQYQINIDDPKAKKIDTRDQMKGRYEQDLQAHDIDKDTELNIVIATDSADASNIGLIKKYMDELKSEFLPDYFSELEKISDEHINDIQEGCDISFSVVNGRLTLPPVDSLESRFLSYCRVINMVSRTRNRELSSQINNPVFFLQSLRQSTVGYSIGIAGVQHQSLHENLNNIISSGGTGISQLASQHFGLLMQNAVDKSSKSIGDVAQALFDAEPDVMLFRNYLGLLSYEWNLVQRSYQFGNYVSEYKKEGVIIEPNKFSSGEKEIISFLDAIISTKVSNGIVLIDEPELHLHPRWQSILLDLIQVFSDKRNLQFIFCTHSPVFVTHETIDAVTRIYLKDGCSRHASIHAADTLPNKAHLVRMINSHNNERIFFADHVVLVEGIMDRLVFDSLVKLIGDRFTRRKSTEVVEVHGKHNFASYKSVLDIVKMPSSIVADQDYILNIGTEELKGLFVTNCDGIDRKVLLDKKSRDSNTLIEAIEKAADTGSFNQVLDVINYIKKRITKLKEDITEEEIQNLNAYISSKVAEEIYVLRLGEIEDYLPPGINSVGSLIVFLEDPDWVRHLQQEARNELLDIVTSILQLSQPDKMAIQTEYMT